MLEQIYFLGQLCIAILLGAVLGFQRERSGKSAGPRTHAMVSVGSTLFTILSLNAFGGGDPARIASQILTGIGFLGAGIIFQRENRVEGLTTAAGLWATAAIGMTVGVEYYGLAIGATFALFLLLSFNDRRFRPNENSKK